jgi:signal peptidase
MTGNQGKSQISISDNKACNIRNKRQEVHIKLSGSNLTQSSALSPQSSDPKLLNFTQVCTDLLHSGILVRFRAPGYSMYPTILHEDVITVEPVEASAVKVGDIILYRDQQSVIAHRVVRIENKSDSQAHSQSSALSPQSQFILRGDARPTGDDPISAEQILGKVVSVKRNGRGINPYSLKVKLTFYVRRLASRLKRFLN